MKKIVALLLALVVVFALVACGANTNTGTNTNTNTGDTNSNTNTGSIPGDDNTDGGNENPGEGGGDETGGGPAPVVPEYDSTTVEEALKEDLKVFEKETTQGSEGEVLDYTTSYEINLSRDALNASYKIDKGGAYRVYGTSSDGQIYVNAVDQHVILVLDNVSLTSGNSIAGPAIYAVDCASVTIVLKEGTTNYLSDNAVNDGEGAVIRVRSCNLTIDGKGTLEVDAKAKNAIANTKELTINGGNYVLNAPGHGIYGKAGVTINGGSFDINSQKSGIKSGDGNSEADYEFGYINIKSGNIDISCGTNGFNCVGPVTVENGKIVINSESGNAIEAVNDVLINGGTMILKSYKSTISSDADVSITGKSNVKLETTGNGISATNVTIATSGVVYIKTVLAYETVTETTSATDTRYVLIDGEYVVYDSTVHGTKVTQYVLRPGKGINADKLTVTNGTIGIDAFQDAINVDSFEATGSTMVLCSLKDAIDASLNVSVSNKADITVLGAEKGINSDAVNISGGKLYIIAAKDAINSDATVVNGGVVYLFDKIDTGVDGTVTVNGGILLMITTNNAPQVTGGEAQYISAPVVNKEYALPGNWINVITGDDVARVELPKDYTDKMVIYYSSETMGEDLMIAFGTVDENNNFTVITTEIVK